MTQRPVEREYQDPLDLVWLGAASRLGWKVVREPSAYASWDGKGTLALAPPDALDEDDCIAQMILHEICHALVAGAKGMALPDWGLDNTTDRDTVSEHATNRLQAALSEPYGLRDFFAVTTEFRSYYDSLEADTLAEGEDPAIPLARAAKHRAECEPFRTILADALGATARVAEAVKGFAPKQSLFQYVRQRHRSGLLMPKGVAKGVCGGCAWLADDESFACRQSARPGGVALRVEPQDPACERFERRFGDDECGRCGACCREGFHVVEVEPNESIVSKHRELVSHSSMGLVLPRPSGKCVALDGGTSTPYRCRVYEDRPRSCRDFEVMGDACLLARQRVGLSRR